MNSRYTESVGVFVGRFALNLFFFLLMVADFIVISSLFTHFMGDNFVISSFATLVLIALIDVLPIFIAIPYMAKILKGLISEEDDPRAYQVAMRFIWSCLTLFIASVTIYYFMSLNYPERFTNPTIQPIIAGLIPLLTTIASSLSNLAMTYFSKKDAALERLIIEKEIEYIKDELAIIGDSDTVLHDIDERVQAIQERITRYIKTHEKHIEIDCKIEESEATHKNQLLQESIMAGFDKLYQDGERAFAENYIGNSREGKTRYQTWKTEMQKTRVTLNTSIEDQK